MKRKCSFNYPNHVYSLVDKFYLSLLLSGFASFTRTKQDGKIVYKAGGVGLRNLIQILAVQLVFTTGLYFRFIYTPKDDPIYYTAIVVQYTCIYVCVSFFQFTFMVQNYIIIDFVTLLEKIDIDLRQIRVRVSFKNCFIIIVSIHCLIPGFPVLLQMSSRTWLMKILDIFAYFYPISVRVVAFTCIIFYLTLLRERFHIVNNYLTELEEFDLDMERSDKLYKRRTLKFSVIHAIDIHRQLTKCIEKFNQLFGIYGFVYLISSFIEMVFLVYYVMKVDGAKNIDRGLSETIIFMLAQVALLGFSGYMAFQIEVLAKETFRILGELSFQIQDEFLIKKMNGYFLEGFYSKVKITVLDMFPMNLSVFQKQIAIVSMFVLLLLQYQ